MPTALPLPPPLRTARLVLRPHGEQDFEPFLVFLSHPTATQYMAFTPEQKTREGAQVMFDCVLASYDSPQPVVSLTIAAAASDEYLGACGLNPLETEGEVEIYYTMVPARQGQGLATEAAAALVEHARRQPGVTRLVAHVVAENVPSIRVAEKLGFRDDGPLEHTAATGELAHACLTGRHYVLPCD